MVWGPFGLDGRVALVTGAAQGIGFGIAAQMRQAGAHVVVVDLDDAAADRATERLAGIDGPGDVIALSADVTDAQACDSAVARAAAVFGRVDILVNNAGVYPTGTLDDVSSSFVERVFGVNVGSVFLMTRSVVTAMLETDGGAVINLASIQGVKPCGPDLSVYGASKAAIVGATKHLARELGRSGIRVNAIVPSSILTEGLADASLGRATLTDDEREFLEDAVVGAYPIRRFGTPEDIGNAAVYLASPAASYVTGAVLAVDGGALIV